MVLKCPYFNVDAAGSTQTSVRTISLSLSENPIVFIIIVIINNNTFYIINKL